MKLPPDLHAVLGIGAQAFAAEESEEWVRSTLAGGEQLHEAASRQTDTLLRGRGPVPVLTTPQGRWVVRHYHRGGMVAGPLLRDRYFRTGVNRPLREAHTSHVLRQRGVPTPRIMAGAVYPRGVFYSADLVTELVTDAADLGYLLFEEERSGPERTNLLEGAGRLLGCTAAAGVQHLDFNAKNVLIARHSGEALPVLLDLDRCRVLPAGIRVDPGNMLNRLRRSLRKYENATGRRLRPEEWSALSRGANAGGSC